MKTSRGDASNAGRPGPVQPGGGNATRTVLITGAAGRLGTLLRSGLARPGRTLRLLDVAQPPPAEPDEAVEVVVGSVIDQALMAEACSGVDAIIHLAGYTRESAWADAVAVNINGTQALFDAAQRAGVNRVILASSNHAAGFRELASAPLPADSSPRPDTYYGVSKAAIEALGSLFASRFGMDVIAIRLGTCGPDPVRLGPRGLMTWLSPGDAVRLFDACLDCPSPGYRIIWGVSDNTRRTVSLSEAEALGYKSQDDAERFAEPTMTTHGADSRYLGGARFCEGQLGVPNPPRANA